jgi:RNA polymerase sigma factor (TIGR02999 family)
LPTSDPTATELLHAWRDGDLEARDRLVSLLYQELRRRASAQLRRERSGHTWQPSDLVHETCLKLLDQRHTAWQNRAHFLAVASELMRRILVDRARARLADKRPGKWAQVTLEGVDLPAATAPVDLLDLDSALKKLEAFDPRKGRIAELRFFGGLSLEETGNVLNLSSKTVERDWQAARAWLFKTLSRRPSGSDGREGLE